jgi:FMN-dependent NADH-azoreductase
MVKLLHIDASPRDEKSHSRRLSREFFEAFKQAYPNSTLTYRDVGRNPISHVDEQWIASAFTPPEKRTPEMLAAIQFSDQLIDEFLASDIYVMGIPMYNFSVPSGFKAYIDQIVRVGKTFAFEPEDKDTPYKPLVHGKKMFIITACGAHGYSPGGSFEAYNYQDPYLKTVFGFLGITDITFIRVENDEFGDHSLAHSIADARAQIAKLIAL